MGIFSPVLWPVGVLILAILVLRCAVLPRVLTGVIFLIPIFRILARLSLDSSRFTISMFPGFGRGIRNLLVRSV